MARRRPFRAKGPSSASSSPSGRSRAGSGPRPQKGGPPRRDHAGSRHDTGSKSRKPAPLTDAEPGTPERLQKVLAHAGLGSRRACEELILQGRVSINGEIIRVLGTRVDPTRARIAVDGEPIKQETMVYYAVNKPKGYVSTTFDPSGRPRVVDLLPEIPQRVYTVGRLDEESTGLLILTNDGELANRLAHPRYGVEKLYRALVAGLPTRETLAKMTEGVWLSDGKVRAKRVRIVGRQGQATTLELVLAEGKKREIRRMLSKLGHKVMSLNRIAVGPISLKGLSIGECRSLSRNEVDLLRKVASGVSVSLPRFFEGGPSPPSRDSQRPRTNEPARSASDEDRSPRRSPLRPSRDARQPQPAHADSIRGRSPRSRPTTTASQDAPSSQQPLDRPKRAGATPPQPRPQPQIKLQVGSKRAKDHAPRRVPPPAQTPPQSVRPQRRIIGMEREPPVGAGLPITGRRKPKRPAVRKRPPPGAALGKKSRPSPDAGRLDVEDE
jgi:23S rRNA pseudouridine2605 synthase